MSDTPFPTRRIAWNGISFPVPATWDLANYKLQRKVTHIELEDDYSVRLQAEWIKPRNKLQISTIRERYLKAARRLSAGAESTTPLENLPPGWTVYLYKMPDDQQLLVAFVLSPDPAAFVFFRIHFSPKDRESPHAVARVLSCGIDFHDRGLLPWEVYDLALELPREFRLVATTFQAGIKHCLFQRRLRRLHIWQASFADMILREKTKEQWAVELLNASKNIRGPCFQVADDGHMTSRRNRLHPLGHSDEIARCCFRYAARCEHDKEANILLLWVFNYRTQKDLRMLEGKVGISPLRPD